MAHRAIKSIVFRLHRCIFSVRSAAVLHNRLLTYLMLVGRERGVSTLGSVLAERFKAAMEEAR